METFITCPLCSLRYNISTRQPLILPCCRDTICKQCVATLMDPENLITCPFDQKVMPKKDIGTNAGLLRSLTKSKLINIACDKHPESQADFYCPAHSTLICSKCAIIGHHDHMALLRDIKRDQIIDFCTHANKVIDLEV